MSAVKIEPLRTCSLGTLVVLDVLIGDDSDTTALECHVHDLAPDHSQGGVQRALKLFRPLAAKLSRATQHRSVILARIAQDLVVMLTILPSAKNPATAPSITVSFSPSSLGRTVSPGPIDSWTYQDCHQGSNRRNRSHVAARNIPLPR